MDCRAIGLWCTHRQCMVLKSASSNKSKGCTVTFPIPLDLASHSLR